jgi:hypothetical protein
MPNAKDLIERARMFDERAEQAADPVRGSITQRWPPTIVRSRSNIGKQAGSNAKRLNPENPSCGERQESSKDRRSSTRPRAATLTGWRLSRLKARLISDCA